MGNSPTWHLPIFILYFPCSSIKQAAACRYETCGCFVLFDSRLSKRHVIGGRERSVVPLPLIVGSPLLAVQEGICTLWLGHHRHSLLRGSALRRNNQEIHLPSHHSPLLQRLKNASRFSAVKPPLNVLRNNSGGSGEGGAIPIADSGSRSAGCWLPLLESLRCFSC